MTMTIREIMDEYGICSQAVRLQIYRGRLNARKKSHNKKHMWIINKSDFENYRKGRYKQPRMINGELIFDKEKGLYSVKEAANYIGCDPQRIYYHLRTGMIPSQRVRSSWVIHIDDINQYKSKLKPNRKKSAGIPFKQMKVVNQ